MRSRRTFVKFIGAIGAFVTFVKCRTTGQPYPGSSVKDDTTVAATPDPEGFLALSKTLTGFDDLDEAISPKFYAELQAHHPGTADALVAAFKAIDPAAPDYESQVTQKIMGDATLGPVAAAAISLWYAGVFTKTAVPEVMGVKAYKSSLVWRAAVGGKPMGVPSEQESSWSAPLAD